MRYYTFILFIFFTALTCCKKDKTPPGTLEEIELSDQIKTFLPAPYKNASKVVFTDSTGLSKTMSLNYRDTIVISNLSSLTYPVGRIDAILTDPDDSSYYISLLISANYFNFDTYNEFMLTATYTSYNNGLIPRISVNEKNEILSGQYKASVTLQGKTFSKVYENAKYDQLIGYKDLLYTKAEGIVAFSDRNNKWWVLDRIE